jgi:FKBP-type peptidyl-prolyl cis-trans isomerase (trigger factor)
MSSVKTSVTELPESRVRVQAEVQAEEVERRVQQAARELGRQMRVPGFRKGKVPPPVVIRRLGREAVLDEALRSALGRWYVDALDEAMSAICPRRDSRSNSRSRSASDRRPSSEITRASRSAVASRTSTTR